MCKYSKDTLEEPTNDLIQMCIDIFNGEEKDNEAVVRLMFTTFDNNSCDAILAKVIVLNNRYSTRLNDSQTNNSDKVDIFTMAQFILNNNKVFDNPLTTENDVIDWVDNARDYFKSKGKDSPYSFLTKYCAWSFQKLDIPIYDSHAKAMLFHINELYKYHDSFTKTKIENGDYKFYCEVYDKFAKEHGNGKNYKDIDKYLWMYAKKHDIKLYPQKEKNSEGKV